MSNTSVIINSDFGAEEINVYYNETNVNFVSIPGIRTARVCSQLITKKVTSWEGFREGASSGIMISGQRKKK